MNSITKSVFIYEQVFTQQFQVLCSNNLRGNILVLVGVSHPLTWREGALMVGRVATRCSRGFLSPPLVCTERGPGDAVLLPGVPLQPGVSYKYSFSAKLQRFLLRAQQEPTPSLLSPLEPLPYLPSSDSALCSPTLWCSFRIWVFLCTAAPRPLEPLRGPGNSPPLPPLLVK